MESEDQPSAKPDRPHPDEPSQKAPRQEKFEYQRGNTRIIRGSFYDPYLKPLGAQKPVQTYRVHRPAV